MIDRFEIDVGVALKSTEGRMQLIDRGLGAPPQM